MSKRRRTHVSGDPSVKYVYAGAELMNGICTEFIPTSEIPSLMRGLEGYYGYMEDGTYGWIYYNISVGDETKYVHPINENTYGNVITRYFQAVLRVNLYENGSYVDQGFIPYYFLDEDIVFEDPHGDLSHTNFSFPSDANSGSTTYYGTWRRTYDSSKKLLTWKYTTPYYTPSGDGNDLMDDFTIYLTYDGSGEAFPIEMIASYTSY